MEGPLSSPDQDTDDSASDDVGLGVHSAIESTKDDAEEVDTKTDDRCDLGENRPIRNEQVRKKVECDRCRVACVG